MYGELVFCIGRRELHPSCPKAQLPIAIEREKHVWGLVVGTMSWADGALVMRLKLSMLVGMVSSLG